MASGSNSWVGLGMQTVFGTSVPLTDFLELTTEGITTAIENIKSAAKRGQVFKQPGFGGAVTLGGNFDFEVNPVSVGHVLRGAFGNVVSTAVGTTHHQHVFDAVTTNWSALSPLPLYTMGIFRGVDQVFRYSDGIFNSINMKVGTGNKIFTASCGMMFRREDAVAPVTTSYTGINPFMWDNIEIRLNNVLRPEIEEFELTYNSHIVGVHSMNRSREARKYSRGDDDVSCELSMTLEFENRIHYAEFLAQSVQPVRINCIGSQMAGTSTTVPVSMEIDIPRFRWTGYPVNVGGPGRILVNATGEVEFNLPTNRFLRATLINGRASYT